VPNPSAPGNYTLPWPASPPSTPTPSTTPAVTSSQPPVTSTQPPVQSTKPPPTSSAPAPVPPPPKGSQGKLLPMPYKSRCPLVSAASLVSSHPDIPLLLIICCHAKEGPGLVASFLDNGQSGYQQNRVLQSFWRLMRSAAASTMRHSRASPATLHGHPPHARQAGPASATTTPITGRCAQIPTSRRTSTDVAQESLHVIYVD
jgi:hypothetical protein